jgi:hypothetical protein
VIRLKTSKGLYGRYPHLIDRYQISISQFITFTQIFLFSIAERNFTGFDDMSKLADAL